MISNKFKISFVLVLLLILLSSNVFASDKKYNIYMVMWNGCEDACIGFQEYLSSKNVNADFILRDAKKDVRNFDKFINEINDGGVDLVTTWGTISAMAMFGDKNNYKDGNYINDLPGVFMVVSQPTEVGLVDSYVSSNRNITGVLNIPSVEEQVKEAYSYIPFKKLGVIYNPQEQNSITNVNKLRSVSKLKDFSLIEEEIVLDNKGQPMSDSLKFLVYRLVERGADVIYVGLDAFVNDNIDIIAKAAIEKNIPLFSVGEKNVKRSRALYSVANHYYNVGLLAGKKAYKILVDGQSPKDIKIDAPSKSSMIINMKWAKKLNIFPPIDLLSSAEIID